MRELRTGGGASDYADDVIVPLGGLLLIFYLQSEGLLRTDLPQHVAGISFLFRFSFFCRGVSIDRSKGRLRPRRNKTRGGEQIELAKKPSQRRTLSFFLLTLSDWMDSERWLLLLAAFYCRLTLLETFQKIK